MVFEADSHRLVAGFTFVMKEERSAVLYFGLSPAGGRGLLWLWFSGVGGCPADGGGGGSNFLEKRAKGKWKGSLANKAEVGIITC